MKSLHKHILFIMSLTLIGASVYSADTDSLPIRGLHCGVPGPDDVALCAQFIREALPKEGVNVLVLEINYKYQFQSHPELAQEGALSRADVEEFVAACKDAGVQLIPQFNCLGHQSWSKRTFPLLTQYPEFDETPGKYPNNEDIYCRSYCPLHPEVHKVVFALIDELAEVFQAGAFHVGMDEVFILGDQDCPRCKNKSKAELFAGEVTALREHLAQSQRTMWMWSDRFINGEWTGIGEWEASENGTEAAILQVPKDIVMCDWHYEMAHATAPYFAIHGFPVVSCPWRKSNVALGLLEITQKVRQYANEPVKQRMQGVLQTTWCGMAPFVRAYNGDENVRSESARESADCFKKLFAAIRGEKK